jgi:hypothetical protein
MLSVFTVFLGGMSLSVLHGKGCRTFTFLRQITLHPVIA